MSRHNVKSFDAEAFKIRLEKLAKADISDADFADAVYTAISSFGLDEDAFRDAFGLTKGATERWTQGQNLPQPVARAKIMLWMKNLV